MGRSECECADYRSHLLGIRHTEVHFSHARPPYELSDVGGGNSAARENLDSTFGLNDEPPDLLGALWRGRCATRRQHALDAEADELLERCGEIGEDVEGAMKRDGERSSGGDEVAGAIEIEVSRHDPLRTRTFGLLNVLQHGPMLGIRIHEIPGARTHQSKNRNRKPGSAGTEELEVWGGAAVREIGAQLDAVGPTVGGRESSVQRLDGALDEDGHTRELTP